jgi:hypothetical protein
MARDYDLNRSDNTGWWVWECKEGNIGGSAPTKSEARAQARTACSGAGGIVSPPDVDVVAFRGYLSNFTVKDLNGNSLTFSAEEIKQSEFSFFYGLPCANDEIIEDTRKVITILKIWGIYRGGLNKEAIQKLHYLSDSDYNILVERKYFGGKIQINDDGEIKWYFPK